MNTSATSAVVLNLARFRTNAKGRKIAICMRIKYCMPSLVAQSVMAVTNADRFSETKMMYALTKPIWETTMDVRMARRIQEPYSLPPMSPKLPETTNLVFTRRRKE